MILFLVVFCMLVAIGFSIASAISDFRSMSIPNIYSAFIILAFVFAYVVVMVSGQGTEFFATWTNHLLAGILVFAVTFVLFILKVMGAGDSKLCSAVALWTGLSGLASLLFYAAVSGAILGLLTIILNKKIIFPAAKEGSWIDQAQKGHKGVPYGIAICIGAIIAFYQLDYFSIDKITLLMGHTENQF